MADSPISLLPAASAVVDADELEINKAGSSEKATAAQLKTYIESGIATFNASVAAQGPGFASDTYLIGSSILIPNGRLQAKTIYKVRFNAVKTGAGSATPIIQVRFGTNGSTADTQRGTLTHSAQTGVIDEMVYEFTAIFRTVGSGSAAVLQSLGQLQHRLSITGFGTGVSEPEIATSGGFDSTVANSIIGLSVNGGSSAAWTVNVVTAELVNLI